MVVGGGISGIQSSLDLAEAGYYVYLVEKAPAIGGTMPMLDKTFPTNDCSMCILSPKLVECGRHLNIKILTCAQVKGIQGEAGDFQVRVLQHRRSVDLEKCTGCGDCANACPVELANEFDAGMGKRKAIYKLYPQATPSAFAIDKRGLPPCRDACPAGVNAQGYIQLIRLGKYKEAWELIYRDNPFPAICGRVCTSPCQDACHRGKIDEPVQIRELKRTVTDHVYQDIENLPLPATEPFNGKKVAVIGGGPGGLSCAYQLAKKGYRVTVFEAQAKAGGMLQTGIPSYRLPKQWVDKEIELIEKLGVEIKLNTALGKEITIEQLQKEGYQAIFLAIGASREVKLDIPGEDTKGILYGIDFLRRVNTGEKIDPGQKVAVIGGGNTAMDAARTAVRLGAGQVSIIYRRSEQEITAQAEEIHHAKQEGIAFQMLTSPKAFHSTNGQLKQIECIKNELGEPDAGGRRRPVPVSGSEYLQEVDTVIIAIGQAPDTESLPVAVNKNGTIIADPHTLALTTPGIFAGGDAVTGPATAIKAIGAGKRAAQSIHNYLQSETQTILDTKTQETASPRFAPGEIPVQKAAQPQHIEPQTRKTNFNEVCTGYTEQQAKEEADRCLNCGVCSECGECVRACLREAINHDMQDTELEIQVGAVILSPGFKAYDAGQLDYYGYGIYPNVITSIELERILSATGPYQGHLIRPSDGQEPRKIAFIQCVGSRNWRIGRDYCSGACCMYALKEAVISKEHSAQPLETTMFFMDMRTHGKDFERYYERAKNEYGVRFVRSRVYGVEETGHNGELKIKYAEENGLLKTEVFDLVVLTIGLTPPPEAEDLAQAAGIELDRFSFCESPEFLPCSTSREGIFVAGVFKGPKDIPETVTEASAAAGYAARLLSSARGSLAKIKEFPPEREITRRQKPRVGVFVCNCGINIGGVINVSNVAEYTAKLKNVVNVEEFLFTCSQDSIEKIKMVIQELDINRVVVASCTPRTHAPLFQSVMQEVGLNPYLYEHVNIREHSSWVHRNWPEVATKKAQQLIKMAVTKVQLLYPIHPSTSEVDHNALVVGGGAAGMVSALSLAEQGYKIYLAEKSNQLGGNARHIFYTFKDKDIQQKVAQLIEQVQQNPLIEVMFGTEIVNVKGYPGNYQTTLTANEQQREITHGVAIIATGAREYQPKEYLYGTDERVITQRELEARLALGQKYNNIVMIQCVGSRNEERPYCSRICCTQAVKNALKAKELNPDANIFILYRDIRTYGLAEEYYTHAREKGVFFVRYEPEESPVVQVKEEKLEVTIKDRILQDELALQADLVVLSAGVVPQEDNGRLSQLFKVPLTADGFFLEAHMKLRPVDFPADGLYLCGMAHAPKSLEESIVQANAAAMRAVTILAKEKLENVAITAVVDKDICIGCGMCVEACDYGARSINEKTKKAEVVEALCQGCGACVAACPSNASQQKGFEKGQLLAMLDAAIG
jgi:heterodisulfide reductase subunit A-like polyferredoxin